MPVNINLAAETTPHPHGESTPGVSPPPAANVREDQSRGNEGNFEEPSMTFKDIEKSAKEFGNQDGKGKKAFVSFARKLVEGGTEGVLTTSREKDSLIHSAKGPVTHAEYLYDTFMKASERESDGTKGEENKQSKDVQVSKVRALIKFGQEYTTDALPLFDKARTLHRQIANSDKANQLKYKSTYTALVSIATAQCRRVEGPHGKKDVKQPVFDEAAIRSVLLTPVEEEKVVTAATLIMQSVRLLEAAMIGRPARGEQPAREPAEDVDHAFPDIIKALRAIAADTDKRDGTTEVRDFDKAKEEAELKRRATEANKALKESQRIAKDKAKKEEEEKKRKSALAEIDTDLSNADIDREMNKDQDDEDETETAESLSLEIEVD